MNIPINRNIDEFKDDFFKGLSFRQCCFAALTLVSGTAGFVVSNLIFGVPQMISVYIVILCAAPWAIWGFIKIKGMPANEYIKKRLTLKKNPISLYRSVEGQSNCLLVPVNETGKKRKKKEKHGKKPMLCSPEPGKYL